jgi:hypothetical protein
MAKFPSRTPRTGLNMRSARRAPSSSGGRPQAGLRRPRPWIFRQRPVSWGWPSPWPWLAGPAGAAPEPPEATAPAPEPAAEPPAASAPDGGGEPAAASDAPPPGDAPAADEPPQGELPPTVWAAGRRLTVRWFARARPLGPAGALGAPAGGGAYVVLVRGAPMAAHVTRDFNRDLTRRLQGSAPRPPGLTIWYARVDGIEELPREGWRQLARGVRRAIGLPPAPPSSSSEPQSQPAPSRRARTGAGRSPNGARA